MKTLLIALVLATISITSAIAVVSTGPAVILAILADSNDVNQKRAQDEFVKQFKDPSSVQFRDTYFSKVTDPALTGIAYCGEYNGKNSYGAYTGFKKFIVLVDTKFVNVVSPTGSSVDRGMLENYWPLMCIEKITK